MPLRYLIGVAVAAALATPGPAHGDSTPAFRTPNGAAYCRMEFGGKGFDAFRCFTPNDGWWIRFTGLIGHDVQVQKGYDRRFRGARPAGYPLLPFGKTWWSSDAAVVTCRSRTTGLTCKHYDGLSFWIGRYKGYRIFVSPAGTRVQIARPFFRTGFDVYCGLGASLEPDAPSLTCWRAGDGLQLTVAHQPGVRAAWLRNGNNRGHRPKGYSLLRAGQTFRWRCTKVGPQFATGCSPRTGTTVFTCTIGTARVTCRNRASRGFWLERSSFYTF